MSCVHMYYEGGQGGDLATALHLGSTWGFSAMEIFATASYMDGQTHVATYSVNSWCHLPGCQQWATICCVSVLNATQSLVALLWSCSLQSLACLQHPEIRMKQLLGQRRLVVVDDTTVAALVVVVVVTVVVVCGSAG